MLIPLKYFSHLRSIKYFNLFLICSFGYAIADESARFDENYRFLRVYFLSGNNVLKLVLSLSDHHHKSVLCSCMADG